ncbi:HAMP domain-containing sensor histidine kinase [Serratia sp. UGAL515B_01]|uniref:sensor histidine kinase n=1 Tax=Serratia sp. UGAL515B_01 TaxID=2986763 RepID=UPI00295351C9|nr:HAMP domain-containing sensor histidine kinase [Serratia sp. UGAL515B_01]WON78014.1 HAMP domain-containing histidine kinase [Serratia sp. UGAL515B_01]
MFKVLLWLVLTLFSGCGVVIYALQQQYEDQSVTYRILYREVTVKLSQAETILSLLSVASDPSIVQQKFPQILAWKPLPKEATTKTLRSADNGTYWLENQSFALLIDPQLLLADIPQIHSFKHIIMSWHNMPLFEIGEGGKSTFWQWHKGISSNLQPFELSAYNNPDWLDLPWSLLLLLSVIWAIVVYFIGQYRIKKRQHSIAVQREHFSELTRLNAMGEITTGIIHELNQPLTAVLSYNQAALRLISQQQTNKVAPLLDAAVIQIKRISTLLLHFRQKLTLEQVAFQEVNFSGVWRRVTMLLENDINQGKVKIINQMPESLPTLRADPLWIEQIFHNIVSNAIQAQQHNNASCAWVAITADHSDQGITLVITDGGPGLSEQALQQVFIPFFTTRHEGLGLGMALTETLVQRLNGSIKAENIIGQGACFTLWFPFNTQEA